MLKKIFRVYDGYHDSTYHFEDGSVIYGEKNFIGFLANPHSEIFLYKEIKTDELENQEDDYLILLQFESENRSFRRNNFYKLEEIWLKYFNS